MFRKWKASGRGKAFVQGQGGQKREQSLCEQRLKKLSLLPKPELVEKFDIEFDKETKGPLGLGARAAEKKLEKVGSNEIVVGKKETAGHRLFEAVVNPFNVVLAIIAVVSVVTDLLTEGVVDYLTIGIIGVMILVASTLSFVQGQRSHAAAAKLASMIANTAGVYRDGKLVEIDMREVVPGDVVRLMAGDMIPADVRFLSTKDTFIAQAALTGESAPVEKFANSRTKEAESITDFHNIGFMGTNVVSGSATAVVLLTGNNTYFGSMAKSLANDRGKNSFERGVSSVSKLLIRMMLVMVPLVFVVNGFLKQDWSASLLFAVSIAVGLTPEMLPMVLSTTLATGAMRMSKKKVIVKNLGAIQAFGEMDILCTDKTGTLTEDNITIERYLTPDNKDSEEVLRYAFLNAKLQSGLKSEIDVAVIARGEKNRISDEGVVEIDEIPFDFARRRMSVVVEDKNGKKMLITKGAVEEMIDISAKIEVDGRVVALDETQEKRAMATYDKHNNEGLRMLAVAIKPLKTHDGEKFGVADEAEMTLVGFIGFFDPPKESAAEAVKALKASGVHTVVLTGDSLGVAKLVCDKVGISTKRALTGKDIDAMDDAALVEAVRDCELFAKLSPAEKERVVRVLQEAGHTVGYLGDGINDAPPLHQADVGISVDTAVDISKETANIILMEKDLLVLNHGVIEGRRTFGNVSKYIKLTVSSNFGNMVAVMGASIFLPFLPMLPIQILVQNLLSDISQVGMPFDNVDEEYLKKPRKWSPKSITRFMLVMGPVSSIFDIGTFLILWFLLGYNSPEMAAAFWGGWFIIGCLTQILVTLVGRTGKVPFLQSRPSWPLLLTTLVVSVAAVVIAFGPLAEALQMETVTVAFLPWIIVILVAYFVAVQMVKGVYKKAFREWI
ncbi:magnesium-translocating P-type ATPase [Candidatus Saccharibacteria bacterium]|nr:magnesium-translocating P-type ATPase [Candidatus Saccharibacteria bacterium]